MPDPVLLITSKVGRKFWLLECTGCGYRDVRLEGKPESTCRRCGKTAWREVGDDRKAEAPVLQD